MAEAALFTIASKLLSTIATPAFKMAYERVQSIWSATDDLEKLKETITSIQAVLLDAERKHNDSSGVKSWVTRVRDVLYEAEDLFDVVATNDLLKQGKKGKKQLNHVRGIFSKLNPIAYGDFIAEKIKAIRKDLQGIYQDMALLGFVKCESDNLSISGIRRGVETGPIVDSEDIIGRDDEKKRVVDFVFNEAYADRTVSLISVVGIGGMGKSSLAQLVYNDAKISGGFSHRCWACISNIFDEKEVLGKINQSMTGRGNYQEFSLDQLQSSTRESINRKGKFLLVLDDLWDEDTVRGRKLLSILSSDHAKGSKIIVTTRLLTVAKAMSADEVLELQGLSWDASWELFRRYAFTKDQENDPTWIRVGENIVRKCSNVPLAIKSIASLLKVKDTIEEWKSLENEQLSKIPISDNLIMATLRLSYDHLPSYLKNCFAYCSLFPKDHLIYKIDLIYLWIAQGYIIPKEGETLKMAGNACFMDLFRRSFFQRAEYGSNLNITMCKMHDLVHDLAENVAGEESCIISTQGNGRSHNKIRHLWVGHDSERLDIDNTLLLLNDDRLRTYLYHGVNTCRQQLNEQFTKFRFLRALGLSSLNIEDVPSSVGKMKYLRYLDLSQNTFTYLPDSITKLVNLITLKINGCSNLVKLPTKIGALVSLRHLINEQCGKLRCMPPTLGELTSLEHLSVFNITKSDDVVDGEFCGLDALGKLNLRGSLSISFDDGVEWSRDEVLFERGHVPDSLEDLCISDYPKMEMSAWWTDINPPSRLHKLESLSICFSEHVKHLPPLRCLPNLTSLCLDWLPNLEFIEDDEVVPNTPFFPSLCKLEIVDMENLKGWSRTKDAILSAAPNDLIFPCLLELSIDCCPLLTSVPISAPLLKSITLRKIMAEVIEQLVSKPCATGVDKIEISYCFDLSNLSGEGLTSLHSLKISNCETLSKVRVAPNTVEEFTIHRCPNIGLWEEGDDDDEMSIDWASFANLRLLTQDTSEQETIWLPDYLQQLVLLGKLRIVYQPPSLADYMEDRSSSSEEEHVGEEHQTRTRRPIYFTATIDNNGHTWLSESHEETDIMLFRL